MADLNAVTFDACQYRKKPVTITAIQLPAEGDDNLDAFLAWAEATGFENFTSERDGFMAIQTLEGVMMAQPGDWIVKGVAGEFYPCKPDIFAATYEPAAAPAPAAQSAGQEAVACPKCGCEHGIAHAPYWNHKGDWTAEAIWVCDKCDGERIINLDAAPVNGGEREPDSFASLGARVFNQRETAEQKDDANAFKRIARYHSERAADAQQVDELELSLNEFAALQRQIAVGEG